MKIENEYTRAVNEVFEELKIAQEKAAKSTKPKFMEERDGRSDPHPLMKLYRKFGIRPENLNG